MAVESYLALPESDDVGARYLTVYLVLQVLYVQQNAIKELTRAFSLSYNPDPALEAIREIRNKTTGHPTRRGDAQSSKVGRQSSHFLARYSIRKGGYKLMTTYADGRTEFQDVDILDLVAKQRAEIRSTLERVCEALKAKEMTHREQFKGEKLVDHFPPGTGYMMSKIAEACYNTSPSAVPVGDAALKTIVAIWRISK